MRRIADAAFASTGLTEVTLNEGVEKIGGGAFSHSSLERVVLVKGIREIGDFAFAHNEKLTELEIHEGIEKMGAWIFDGTSLRIITLPLHAIPQFDEKAFRFEESTGVSSVPTLTTLRLRGTYHASPSISFPRQRDSGQLVRFVRDQQAKYLRAELLVANAVFYTCFMLKCRCRGIA